MGRFDRYTTHHRTRRLAGFDYASAGWYFVTICTRDRQRLLGEIRDGIMALSEAGCIAHTCWHAIPNHVQRVHLGAFVVMPNHVHGLIALTPQEAAPCPPETTPRPLAGSLSSVVGSYKSAVTRAVRRTGTPFAWQARFHDHIVRTDRALRHIWEYIEANPARWAEDTFNTSL